MRGEMIAESLPWEGHRVGAGGDLVVGYPLYVSTPCPVLSYLASNWKKSKSTVISVEAPPALAPIPTIGLRREAVI